MFHMSIRLPFRHNDGSVAANSCVVDVSDSVDRNGKLFQTFSGEIRTVPSSDGREPRLARLYHQHHPIRCLVASFESCGMLTYAVGNYRSV